MNSYSHYAFGTVGEWLYRYLAGIDEAAGSVGFGTIEIRPRWAAPLDSVRVVYRSPRGTIVSAWRRLASGSVQLTVTIPPNTTGRVFVRSEYPEAVVARGARLESAGEGRAIFAIEAGTYRFVVPQ